LLIITRHSNFSFYKPQFLPSDNQQQPIFIFGEIVIFQKKTEKCSGGGNIIETFKYNMRNLSEGY